MKIAKILVVDEAALTRMRCSRLLVENGYEVCEAADAGEALDKYRSDRPDVVLLDITRSNMDGLVILKNLMKIDPTAKLSLVTAAELAHSGN